MLFLLFGFTFKVSAQKVDKDFRQFYTQFQEAVAKADSTGFKSLCYFPFQTIYWVDGLNQLTEEEKQDGLLNDDTFGHYFPKIVNANVKRLVPSMGVDRIQQIDVEASGDYYKRLGKLIDPESILYELYCQFSDNSTVDDNHFAFLFGRVGGEFRILAYYTTGRVKG